MSIRIYDAYISRESDLTISKIRARCIRLQDRCKSKRLDLIRERFGPVEDYRKIASNLRDRADAVKKTQRRDPDVDFNFDIVLFPLHSFWLFKLYTEQAAFIELFEDTFSLARDFHYQNSTDRPSHITQAEWDYRRRVWDYVVGASTPSKRGFTINISDYNWPWFNDVYPDIGGLNG